MQEILQDTQSPHLPLDPWKEGMGRGVFSVFMAVIFPCPLGVGRLVPGLGGIFLGGCHLNPRP